LARLSAKHTNYAATTVNANLHRFLLGATTLAVRGSRRPRRFKQHSRKHSTGLGTFDTEHEAGIAYDAAFFVTYGFKNE
jgi:hypothetical protein